MTTTSNGIPAHPRPYGRQPVALRGLAEAITLQLERELRAAGVDSYIGVKAFWLRAGDADSYGWPDYRYAYVWVAPVVMSPRLCEVFGTPDWQHSTHLVGEPLGWPTCSCHASSRFQTPGQRQIRP